MKSKPFCCNFFYCEVIRLTREFMFMLFMHKVLAPTTTKVPAAFQHCTSHAAPSLPFPWHSNLSPPRGNLDSTVRASEPAPGSQLCPTWVQHQRLDSSGFITVWSQGNVRPPILSFIYIFLLWNFNSFWQFIKIFVYVLKNPCIILWVE